MPALRFNHMELTLSKGALARDGDAIRRFYGEGLALPEQAAYDLTKALVENLDRIRRVHTEMRRLDAAHLASHTVIPYHAGALRYYREAGLVE